MPNVNMLILRRAVILCAVAVPVVAFNIFAHFEQTQAISYWSVALTAAYTVLGTAFILWAASVRLLRTGSH